MQMRHIRSLAVAASALWFGLPPVAAHAYSTLYVFGDSLSDVGNIYAATAGKEPAAPYVNALLSG